ncbi:DegT/DnrJ/EryC1/StrS family aminotransferase [Arthrobacter pigmenti]
MNFSIQLSVPDVGPVEEAALLRAFRSGWVAPAGPELDHFEAEIAAATGRAHAVALSSGTAALHLALLAHGVGPGDVVPCSSMTFAATANAIIYTGARPYFIDSDGSGNMDVGLLASALSQLSGQGHRVGAIVPVDLLGKVADYPAICALGAAYGVPVIADAAESLGATLAGRPAGSFGAAAILSFNGNKIITSSGGGALVCDDPDIAARARYLATQARQPVPHYEHIDVGFNYRLSNLLAALGRAQLGRLPELLAARRSIRAQYRTLCGGHDGMEIFGGDDGGDNCWLTALVIDPARAGFNAAALGAHLRSRGIETRPLWKPMHLQPVFADPVQYPRQTNGTSEAFFKNGLTLPSGSTLTSEQRRTVLQEIESFSRVDQFVA